MDEKNMNPELNPQDNEKHIMTDEELAASIYESDTVRNMSDDELQAVILDDSDMNAFQKFINRMGDSKWKLTQRVVGALLGVLCAVALFWDSISGAAQAEGQESPFSMSLIIAVVIAMLVPNIIEKQSQRKAPQLRVALAVSLCIVLAIYVACMIAGVIG